MRFRPCIDIHNGKVKQIVGSTLTDSNDILSENYISEKGAAYYASLYKEHSLSGGHIILLNKSGTPEYDADLSEALDALNTYPGGLMIGGGITPENAALFIERGASHVIVTSYIFSGKYLDRVKLEEI
ncbi:MAG: phosphoribosylformimino-5-aminoimidazole carboxamide ribotide isomerase, partial [Lachnospiraceae bacterium]|nr:phosphoribosylformimino-5-aminoimidazole carboxamide ribotide isomerase [Lachnospiraceae bacterium]